MTHRWLEIALIAYSIGAIIEGVTTACQLSHSAPIFVKGTQEEQANESTTPPNPMWKVVVAIASISTCGAFYWPCRLIHRSIREHTSSKDL